MSCFISWKGQGLANASKVIKMCKPCLLTLMCHPHLELELFTGDCVLVIVYRVGIEESLKNIGSYKINAVKTLH